MKTEHEVLMENPEFRRLLSIEALVAEASEAIAKLMAEQKVSKADLARRLNKSRAWVTQLLSGKANMTVRTLAEVVYTLDAEVKLHAQPPSWKMAGRSRRTRTLLRKYIPEGVMLSDELIGGRRVEAGRGRLRVRTTS